QLGGRDTALAAITAESRRSRALREQREAIAAAVPAGTVRPAADASVRDRPPVRAELRSEAAVLPDPAPHPPTDPPPLPAPRRRMPAPSGPGWSEPEPEREPQYVLYRPRQVAPAPTTSRAAERERVRAEALREL